MLEITVCKFGGSSLADAEGFRRVRSIVRSDARRRYIVVSAPGKRSAEDIKITDQLIASAGLTGIEQHAALDRVREKFCRIALDLRLPPPYDALSHFRSFARRGRDAIASRGEHINARLLAEYLSMPFIDSAEIFVFRNGTLDAEATYNNLRAIGPCGVIPGFYGADEGGSIVTFPRGGSDITASHVAAATGAQLYENWTDVDGFFTADPALVPEAIPIPRMDPNQARLFACLGAGVLHYDSIAPAAGSGVPILVKNTFHPSRPGTLIHSGGSCRLPCVAVRPLPEGSFLLSAANLENDMLQAACEAIPKEKFICEYGGTISVECRSDELPILANKLHRACLGKID